jgi:hypothetical protein
MLFVSLILSILMLLTANLLAWAGRQGHKGVVGLVGVLLLGPLLLFSLALPACLIQAVFLAGLGVFWGRRAGSFLQLAGLSCAATLAAYVLPVLAALGMEREFARLRARYPYEPMAARLAGAKPAVLAALLPPDSLERIARLERQMPEQAGTRRHYLRMLHEDALAQFINSPGFGVGRMARPNEWGLTAGLPRDPVPAQPGAAFTATWSPGSPSAPYLFLREALGGLLEASTVDFVNPAGFGYAKDRRHVAGFAAHRFRDVPRPAERWQVQRLELVSLLLHDEPAV